MDKAQLAVERFRNGYACSQAIATAYASAYGMNEQDVLRLSAGFAAGMRMGSTCGAVTGAYMILGLHAAGADCVTAQGRAGVYDLVQEFTRRFRARNGGVNCCELLGCDISQPEGMQRAKANNLFKDKCPQYVRDAAEILDELRLG